MKTSVNLIAAVLVSAASVSTYAINFNNVNYSAIEALRAGLNNAVYGHASTDQAEAALKNLNSDSLEQAKASIKDPAPRALMDSLITGFSAHQQTTITRVPTLTTSKPAQAIGPNHIKVQQMQAALADARGRALQHANALRTESQAVALANARMAAQDAKVRVNSTPAKGVTTSALTGYHVDHIAQNVSATVARQEGQLRTAANQQRTAQQASALADARGRALQHANALRTESQAVALADARGQAKIAANVTRTAQQTEALAAAEGESRMAANLARTQMQVTALSAAKVTNAEKINVTVTSVKPETPVNVTINGVTHKTTAAAIAKVAPDIQVAVAHIPAFIRSSGHGNRHEKGNSHDNAKGHTGRGSENAQASAHNSPNGRAHGL